MKYVLVVDDSRAVRIQVAAYLKEAGFETLEAGDGLEAWKVVRTRSDVGVVVLDVNMPNMDGLQLLEILRAEGRLEEIAIVMLTTESEVRFVERAKRAGAKGWVVKPFRADTLVKAVRMASIALHERGGKRVDS